MKGELHGRRFFTLCYCITARSSPADCDSALVSWDRYWGKFSSLVVSVVATCDGFTFNQTRKREEQKNTSKLRFADPFCLILLFYISDVCVFSSLQLKLAPMRMRDFFQERFIFARMHRTLLARVSQKVTFWQLHGQR